jgi:hypothetical protein
MQKEAENMESFNSPSNNSAGSDCHHSSPENHHNLLSKGSLSPFITNGAGGDIETSPYKSKFTVLKFSQKKLDSKSPVKLQQFQSPAKQKVEISPFNLSPQKVSMVSMSNSDSKALATNLFGEQNYTRENSI